MANTNKNVDLFQLVEVENGRFTVTFPGLERPVSGSIEHLTFTVENIDECVKSMAYDEETKEFWKEMLPEILNVAEFKIRIYESCGCKW